MDSEYYSWRIHAEEAGLSHIASTAYYLKDSKQLYGVYVNGNPIPAPIFSYRDWVVQEEIEYPIKSVDMNKISDYNEKVIQELENIMAFRTGDIETEPEIGKNTWNGDVFGVVGADRYDIDLELQKTDYYTVRSHAGFLEEELYKTLYEAGIAPDASWKDIQEEMPRLYCQYREEHADTFEDMLEFDTPRLYGGTGITFFKTGNTYKFPIVKRDETVSEASEWWAPLPAGVFQPHAENEEVTLRNHFYKELSENFYGLSQQEKVPEDYSQITKMHDNLTDETEESGMFHTATGIDCKSGNIQSFGATVFSDPEIYYDIKDISAENMPNTSQIEFIDVQDTQILEKLLNITVMTPQNVMGLSEGLFLLEDEFNANLGVVLKRM